MEKLKYRRVDVRHTDTHEMHYFIHQAKVQPATLSEAKADLTYVGPTWLDKQFDNPSPVMAPEILENIEALKRERLQFLISISLRKNENPLSFFKELRAAERKAFVGDLEKKMRQSHLPNVDHFSGKMHKYEVKLRGGTYMVASNKKNFVVLPADQNLRKLKGETIKVSTIKNKNGRTRVVAVRSKNQRRDNSKEAMER